MNVPLGISGYYDLSLRNPKDGRGYPLGRARNLITNAGIDAPARWAWARCFEVVAVGTGTAAALPTDTKLQSFLARSKTYASGANGVSYPNSGSGDYSVRELYRTFVAYQNRSGAGKQVNELGVSWDDVDNPDLFSRVALASPVSVPDGFDLLVRYTLRFQFAQDTFEVWKPLTLTIGSQVVPGKFAMCVGVSFSYPDRFGMSYIFDTGLSGGVVPSGADAGRADTYKCLLEPSMSGTRLWAGLDSTVTASASACDPTANVVNGTLLDYVAGSASRVRRFTFPAALIPGKSDLRTIAVGHSPYGNTLASSSSDTSHQVRFLADAVFTKPTTVQWDVDFTLTWARAA